MNDLHRFLLALCLAAILAACGGGGGSDPTPAGLTGTWFGTLEDDVLALHTVSITINGTNITAIAIDGASTGLTGTITQESPQVHSFSLSDGVVGGFFVDASSTHAAFADDDFNFGVVQKGAASLPTYSYTADLVGAWSGIAVETDFDIFAQVNSSANCALGSFVDCTVTTVSRTSSVNFTGAFNSTFGRWSGVYTAPGSITGNISTFLSADKTFAATWACDDPDQFWPDDCVFSAWRR